MCHTNRSLKNIFARESAPLGRQGFRGSSIEPLTKAIQPNQNVFDWRPLRGTKEYIHATQCLWMARLLYSPPLKERFCSSNAKAQNLKRWLVASIGTILVGIASWLYRSYIIHNANVSAAFGGVGCVVLLAALVGALGDQSNERDEQKKVDLLTDHGEIKRCFHPGYFNAEAAGGQDWNSLGVLC